jgi:hypothetical protein
MEKRAYIMIIVIQERLGREQIRLTLSQTLLPTQRKLVLPCLVDFPGLDTNIVCRCLHKLEQES